MASPSRPVFALALTDPKWVRAYVNERQLGRVHPGQKARVVTDSVPERPVDGRVGYISSVAEFTPKTVETEDLRTSLVYEIRVLLDDPEDRLRLGMPATVYLDEPGAGVGSDGDGGPGRGVWTGQALRHPRRHPASRARRGQPADSGGRLSALVGPDGAGKTTLLRLIAGLMKADGGQLRVLGLDVGAEPQAVQDRISYMPQKFGLYEDLTIQENLDLYADLHGVEPGQRKERFARLLEMTDLSRFTGRLAGQLSGGMKQKLGLACTLVRSPDLLLLDEPTVGVDPLSRRELWQIIEQLIEQERLSVLISTAYMDEAQRCAQVFVLYQGNLIAEEPRKT